jgi:group I intron endonuclease
MDIFIYGLYDPRNDELKYVGKTKNINRRFTEHIKETKNSGRGRKNSWIRKLLKNDLYPIIKILEICNENNWEERERNWIKNCRNLGINILNDTDGGDGGLGQICTEETRKKFSLLRKGKKLSSEPIEKIRLSHLGKTSSEETKRKIGLKSIGRQANLGNRHTEETKKKISEKKKGIKQTEEHKLKVIEGRKGYRHSKETKAKIGASNSVANKGRKLSDDHKKKIREGLRNGGIEKIRLGKLGKKPSPESRVKMSESAKKAWERRKANK